MTGPVVSASAFVAPGAVVRGRVQIRDRAVIMFGAVIRAEDDEIVIGEETNIQDNAVVHCDAGYPVAIGSATTVGHGAVVHGASIGDGCLVGIGAMALNGSSLGDGAWLAAGSVLTEGGRIPPGTLGVGAPATPRRELTSEEVERQRSGVRAYLDLAERYRSR